MAVRSQVAEHPAGCGWTQAKVASPAFIANAIMSLQPQRTLLLDGHMTELQPRWSLMRMAPMLSAATEIAFTELVPGKIRHAGAGCACVVCNVQNETSPRGW
jgi:nucleoside 2-deoxyribosyltransferase